MKELEKTRKISVSGVLFIVVILIGFLTFQKPKIVFQTEAKDTLKTVLSDEFTLKKATSLNSETDLIIDVRTAFEYEQGHFTNALNIPIARLLEDESLSIYKKSLDNNLLMNIYGKSTKDASNTALFLSSLGYHNVKVIDGQYSRQEDKFISQRAFESPALDYADFMKKAAEGKVVIKKPKKKVLQIKKKKKKGAEGGC